MIIFDLDGTLADCEHRRHFVDPEKGLCKWEHTPTKEIYYTNGRMGEKLNWKPDWQAFYEACDKDVPIQPTVNVFRDIHLTYPECQEVEIWSARCESVKVKTLVWIKKNLGIGFYTDTYPKLKMRPLGDSMPDDQLKEKWLDEALAEGKKIDFVFDDRPKVIRMWRKRGIFVFNCAQHDGEF